MIYTLKYPIERFINGKDIKIEKIEFLPLKAKHLMRGTENLQGLLEDFDLNCAYEKTVKDVLFNLSGEHITETQKYERLILEVCKRHTNSSFLTKSIFYQKIDELIRNLYFKPVNGVTLAKGLTSDNGIKYLELDNEYQDLYEEDVVAIRELIKKNYSSKQTGQV